METVFRLNNSGSYLRVSNYIHSYNTAYITRHDLLSSWVLAKLNTGRTSTRNPHYSLAKPHHRSLAHHSIHPDSNGVAVHLYGDIDSPDYPDLELVAVAVAVAAVAKLVHWSSDRERARSLDVLDGMHFLQSALDTKLHAVLSEGAEHTLETPAPALVPVLAVDVSAPAFHALSVP
jgi:hypothetical protein